MKRYAMEFVGTFFLALAITLTGNPIAIGLMLMAMLYVGGHISGAHFNPAISFACFIQNKLNLIDMGLYVAAQSCGALLALCFFAMITNNSYALEMVPGNYVSGPLSIEALFALVLCWVYLVMNYDIYYKGGVHAGIIIGLTLMGIAFVGSLFNPAVAIASIGYSFFKEGVCGEVGTIVVYIVGPLLGAVGASFLFGCFKRDAII